MYPFNYVHLYFILMNKYNNTSLLPFTVINIILIVNILYYYIRKTYTAVLSGTWPGTGRRLQY